MSKRNRSFDLQDVVDYFSKVPQPIKSRGNVEYKLNIEKLEEISKTQGLIPLHIEALIDVAASYKHGEAISSRLIKACVPASTVPQGAVVKAISHMCTNKPSTNIQSLLFRWILLVYDYFDQKDKLHKLYSFIFCFIDNQILLPHVCHLLYLLTRKEDVRLYRVQQLLNMQNKTGPQSYLIGLLTMYKLYAPNMVTVVLPKTKRLFFPMRDRAWWAIIKKVQEKNQPMDDLDTTSAAADRLKLADSSQIRGAPVTKRRKVDPVPVIHQDPEAPSGGPSDTAFTKLERNEKPILEITDLKSLLEQPEKVQFPSQLGSMLRSPLLQHVMSYSADQVLVSRFSYWLHDTLCDELLDNDIDDVDINRIETLLQRFLQFSIFLQEGIPVVDKFLFRYLDHWNGQDFKTKILQLITYCRLYPFAELNEKILEPLRKIFFCNSVYMKCHIILCLIDLLENYTSRELHRYVDENHGNRGIGALYTIKPHKTVFQEDSEPLDPFSTILQLIKFIDGLCVVGLQIENSHTLLMHVTQQFMELVSKLTETRGIPYVFVPSRHLFYKAFFTDNALGANSICKILNNLKASIRHYGTLSRERKGLKSRYNHQGTIKQCNNLITDVAKALWSGKAFTQSPESTESTCFNFDPAAHDSSLTEVSHCFTVYLHQAFIGYALKFLKETQPVGNLGHPRGIKPQRDVYLEFLQREHVTGVSNFVSSFIRKDSIGGHTKSIRMSTS